MELFLLIIRLALAGVFALAGVAKFMDLSGAEKAGADFGIPERWAKPYAIGLSAAEILIAVFLLFTVTSFIGAVLAAWLLVIFIGGMAYQLINGRSPDCHCFGQLYSKPVSKFSIFRNVVLLVLPFILVASGRNSQGIDVWEIQGGMAPTLLTAVITVMMVIAINYLRKIAEQQNVILRRIELLELVSNEGNVVQRDDAGDPYEGLPIGARFPDFELSDVSAGTVKLRELANGRKALLFLFVGPKCNPCGALVPEIAEWRERLADKTQIVLFSSGTAKENEKKFGTDGLILLEKDRDIANMVGARWTPTALLVSPFGKVASHLAVGDNAIRSLVDKIANSDVTDPFFYFATKPDHGRPPRIGQPVPEFTLSDIDGERVTQSQITGRRTLVTFWSPGCPHCGEMLNSLREWETSRSIDDPGLVVFSDGSIDELKALGLKAPIVIDPGYKVAAGLGMFGTPSAVLVDETGTIITETAVGATNIWALLGRYGTNGSRSHNHQLNGKSN
jgi:peroxiredoxin/uncharacterized membrane protein YphA (DoxX/SURF4 family)